jgi:hypothetical protein
MQPLIAPFSQPDRRILTQVHIAQITALIMVGIIAAAILFGWLLPSFGSLLPHGWSLMKANTALAFLLGTASLALTNTRSSRT